MDVVVRESPDELIGQFSHLSVLTARRYRHLLPSGLDFDDLVGAGSFGLCRAAREFDSARGVKFVSFAIHLIRGAILEQLRSWDVCTRNHRDKIKLGEATAPTFVALDGHVSRFGREPASLYDVLEDDQPGPEALAIQSEERSVLSAAVDCLPERERHVIAMYYFEHLSDKQVGHVMEISESRAYQIRKRALARLRKQLSSGMHGQGRLAR